MPRIAKELSSLEVKRIKKPGLHSVGGVPGLHLRLGLSGGRSWILRAVVGNKRKDIGLGGYPAVTLAEAREAARNARKLIRQGVDPTEVRRVERAALIAAQAKALTFEEAAELCHSSKSPEFRSAKHKADWINSINSHVNPLIGAVLVADVDMTHVIAVLKPIWTTKTETATRVRQRIESVLAWAAVNGYRDGDNPARWKGNLEHALPKPSKIRERRHFPALHWSDVSKFMKRLRQKRGVSARALEFAILTAARSGEVRGAKWTEIDMDARVWTIPAKRMKAGKPHSIPLSDPALNILKQLPVLEGCPYVFPSSKGKKLSDMALNQITRRMEIDAVPHGFRSTFKDWARTSTSFSDEVSELALAHVSTDATRAAYARDALLPKRQRMMEDWAEFCLSSPTENTITTITGVNR